jgi:mRNA-degrading endonuclease toxin of MazEF toxin-antitoxin module
LTPGQIVKVNKLRPGIVVSSPRFYWKIAFELIVPLTGSEELAIEDAAVQIEPSPENECTKPNYAVSWNVQCVPHARLTETPSKISNAVLAKIRKHIATCIA